MVYLCLRRVLMSVLVDDGRMLILVIVSGWFLLCFSCRFLRLIFVVSMLCSSRVSLLGWLGMIMGIEMYVVGGVLCLLGIWVCFLLLAVISWVTRVCGFGLDGGIAFALVLVARMLIVASTLLRFVRIVCSVRDIAVALLVRIWVYSCGSLVVMCVMLWIF